MQGHQSNGKQRRCPVCGYLYLREVVRTEQFDVDDEGRVVKVTAENVPAEVCDGCGESFTGPAAWQIKDLAMRNALALLTPSEIVGLRERLRLSATEFAQLTGVEEVTLSDMERGRIIQNRATDRYLRLLEKNPANIDTLRQLAGHAAPAVAEAAFSG